MRSQTVGASQFTETFETPVASPAKGSSSQDDFATMLHQATEDTATEERQRRLKDGAETNDAGSLQLPHSQSSDALSKSGSAGTPGTRTVADHTPKSSKTLDAQSQRPQIQKPSTPTMSIDQESAIPIASDLAAEVAQTSQAPTAPADTPNTPSISGLAQSDPNSHKQGDQLTLPSASTPVNGELTKPTTVGHKTGSFRDGRLGTHVHSNADANNTQNLMTVTNSERTIVVTNQENSGTSLPVSELQNQVAPPVTNRAITVATRATMPAGQRGELPTEKSAGARTDNEATSIPEAGAPSSMSDVPDTGEFTSTKVTSSEASNVSLPDAIAISGASIHAIFAPAGTTLDVLPAISGHSPETRNTSATLVHDLAATATQLQTEVASNGAFPHTNLSASATSLEVGVASSTHGWLKIRAELTGTGEVNASLTGGSPAAADRLRNDLPALSSYLQAEKLQISGLDVHAPLHTAVTTASEAAATVIASDGSTYTGTSDFAGSAGGRPQQQGGRESSEGRPEVMPDRTSDPGVFKSGAGLGGNADLSSVEYGTGGGWLNVRA